MEFGLIALLGLGLVSLFGIFDDNNSADDADPDPSEGQLLEDDGTQTSIDGGEGNDTLVAATDSALTSIHLNGGDDVFSTFNNADIDAQFYGGDGNDSLSDRSGFSEIFGEAGDDTIVGAALVDGGAGDDVLTWIERGTVEGRDFLKGGDGNDTINASDSFGEAEQYDYSSFPMLTGGDGDDTFKLQLNLQNVSPREEGMELDLTQPITDATGITITDFIPGEDQLEVTVDRTIDGVAREMTSLAFEAGGEADNPYTRMSMTFAGNAFNPEVTTYINIYSATPITSEDVVLLLDT